MLTSALKASSTGCLLLLLPDYERDKIACSSRECGNLGGSAFVLSFLFVCFIFFFSDTGYATMDSLRAQFEASRRNAVPTRGENAPDFGTNRNDFTYLLIGYLCKRTHT